MSPEALAEGLLNDPAWWADKAAAMLRAHAARLVEAEATGALAERERLRRVGNPRKWRCFHCDEVFVTEDEARDD